VPIYEYECSACGKSFEMFLGVHDKPIKKCPQCNSSRIKKLVSNCSFQLKGSGWYVTDYARKDDPGKKKQKKSDTKETDAAQGKTDSKKSTESKPAESTAATKAA
jgi:putative FmdB family regulatory protein